MHSFHKWWLDFGIPEQKELHKLKGFDISALLMTAFVFHFIQV